MGATMRSWSLFVLLGACAVDSPGGLVGAELHPDNPHAAQVRVSVDADATVQVVYGEGGSYDRSTPAVELSAGDEVELAVLGLRAGRTYTLSAVVDDGRHQWSSATQVVHTPALPAEWPRCRVVSEAPPDTFGPDEVVCTDFYLEDSYEVRFACVDREGEVVFQVAPDEGIDIMATTALRDGGFASASFSVDRITHFDSMGSALDGWYSLWFQGKTRFVHDWIDGHEVIQLNTGPWAGALAFITYTYDVVDDEPLFAGGIVVLDPLTEEVLWDWSSHGELYDEEPIDPKLDYARRGQIDYEEDWQHANALVHGLDDDGGQFFWISLRHQDWIVKVDVQTDEVVWRLGWDGDFTLVEDLDDPDSPEADPSLWFYHQHAPELQSHGDGRARFLVFDNGNVRVDRDGEPLIGAPYSRVAELEIDEHAMRAQLVWAYGPDDVGDPRHFFAAGVGDADMLPGGDRVQFVVGASAETPFVGEVSYPDGELLWQLQCDPVEWLYRVAYYPSLYERTWWYEVDR